MDKDTKMLQELVDESDDSDFDPEDSENEGEEGKEGKGGGDERPEPPTLELPIEKFNISTPAKGGTESKEQEV